MDNEHIRVNENASSVFNCPRLKDELKNMIRNDTCKDHDQVPEK
jgi:hypothetical protein